MPEVVAAAIEPQSRNPRVAKNTSRRAALSWRSLLAILLVALAVRGLVLAGTLEKSEMDGLARGYESSALALAAGYGYVRPAENAPAEVDLRSLARQMAARGERLSPANAPHITPARWRPISLHPPGYAYFLLALYRTLGPPMTLWARILEGLADAGACVLVALVGARLAGPWAGRFAGFGAALFLPAAYLATSRIADGAAQPLYVLFFALLIHALDRRSWPAWAGAGLVGGILFQLRPDFALAPPLFAGVAWLVLPRRREIFLGAALMGLVMALLVLPWAIRNQRVMGRLTPGTTAVGMSLVMGVGQFANPYGISPQDGWSGDQAHAAGFESFDDVGADSMFRARFRRIAAENPALIASGMMKRFLLAIATPYHFGYENPFYAGHGFYEYHDREGLGPLAALRRHPVEILRAYWDRFLFVPISVLLFAATLGMFFLVQRRGVALLIALPWAYLVAVHLNFLLTTRMLVPGVFAQILALGVCVANLRGRLDDLAAPGES